MAHWFEVLKIIDAALKSDTKRVAGYAKMLSSKLETEGDRKTALSIEKLITSKNMGGITANSVGSFKLPFDQESKFNLGEIFNPEDISEEVVLNSDVKEGVEKFIRYYDNKDRLILEGLEPPNTILLYGPPGCGKTLLAKNLSKQINLPIVVVRLDSLISSFLGSTAKNIRSIFEYAQNNPCILFFDEFDAVAKLRDDKHELGELKRVVNSLLQNIDMMENGSILIAATNHEQLLDPAVWRRFSFKLHILKPDFKARKELISNALNGYEGCDFELLANLCEDLSGAAINSLCLNVKREAILENSNKISVSDFLEFMFNDMYATDSGILPISKKQGIEEKILYVRDLDPKFFTYNMLSEVFGVSPSTISRLIKSRG